MKCFECNGTGARDPDCWVCRGQMAVKWRRVVRLGWKKEWLDGLDPGADYCRCPREGCHGDECAFCGGAGKAHPGDFQREVTRVLVYGLTQHMPPALERVTLPNGRSVVREDEERCLSAAAARHVNEKGWGWRLNSMLGHEFYLRPNGEAEAKRRYPAWLNWLSETSFDHWLAWMSHDDRGWWREPEPLDPIVAARWVDDGGAVHD